MSNVILDTHSVLSRVGTCLNEIERLMQQNDFQSASLKIETSKRNLRRISGQVPDQCVQQLFDALQSLDSICKEELDLTDGQDSNDPGFAAPRSSLGKYKWLQFIAIFMGEPFIVVLSMVGFCSLSQSLVIRFRNEIKSIL